MTQVSVRELKTHLSKYLHLAESGEAVIVTSHNKAVAKLCGLPRTSNAGLRQMLESGMASWSGKRPLFDRRKTRPVIQGKTLAETILESRG